MLNRPARLAIVADGAGLGLVTELLDHQVPEDHARTSSVERLRADGGLHPMAAGIVRQVDAAVGVVEIERARGQL
ncbi:hypothetical protein D3C72_2210800 [compost metagenome]